MEDGLAVVWPVYPPLSPALHLLYSTVKESMPFFFQSSQRINIVFVFKTDCHSL